MTKQNGYGTFQQWIKRITQWFRATFQPGHKPPRILEEHYSDQGALLRLECYEPGVVSMWKLVHRSSTSDLLITLVALRKLREDLAFERQHITNRKATPYRDWRRAFEIELADQLKNQADVDATHIFLVAWVSRTPVKERTDKSGRVYRFVATHCTHAILCDLQGNSTAWTTENLYARKITEIIVKRLLRLPRSPYFSWEELVREIDWITWLDFYAKHAFGQVHLLQPKKSSRKK